MKILQVIHGYPMRYNAGSEVYTQSLCQALAERHEVHVFTREENPFAPDYMLREESDPIDARVTLHVINLARNRSRYRDDNVDQRFAALLDSIRPEVVHIGHLNHLSTSLVTQAAKREIPVVYTLHDYWLMCPRGQFIQIHPQNADNIWALCDGQEDRKCSRRCYLRDCSGNPDHAQQEEDNWTRWVERRMNHTRQISAQIDRFIAPSQTLYARFRDEFNLPEYKLTYLDYGFPLERFKKRQRIAGEPFTFGYIGTHTVPKGIHHLIEAFGKVEGRPLLRIWGRARGQETQALQNLAHQLPGNAFDRIQWQSEYRNQEIVADVFNHVDVIVVPSIWMENSPLVIHEALQARLPVITANMGGMAEYVHHEVNGLLFEPRQPASLAEQMQRLVNHPEWAAKLGRRGYLQSESGDVVAMSTHVQAVETVYQEVLQRRNSARIQPRQGPWRSTFDTNPDTCNLHCIMCEEHSVHSSLQKERKASGRPRRIMPIEIIARTIAEAVPRGLREVIPSTMGEPLLYDDFDALLELCRQHGVKLNLTTNGTFPRRGARDWAERIVPVTSDVKISWNGATPETQELIMGGTRWHKVLNNVRTFVEVRDAHATQGGNRCRITFQLTFLETNVDELADIVRLAIDLGIDRVKGHHLWAHFKEIQSLSMRRNTASIARWNQAVIAAQHVAAAHKLPNGETILLENIFPLNESAREDIAPGGACPFLGQEAWISAEGRFDPCCAPDAQRRTLGEFGNLQEIPLIDIWQGRAYQQLTKTYRNHALCVKCNMRSPVK